MSREPINRILADNLRHYMQASQIKTQQALGRKSGIAQRTIGNYLDPGLRREGSKGKAPSANLAQLEKLADALGVQVWELLRPLTPAQRVVHQKLEEAFAEVLALTTADERNSAVQLHETRKRYGV